MVARKLNVLVYAGTGTTITSVRQCIYTLRRLLSPNYAVVPLTEDALLREPWASTATLLVIPGGADLDYCRILNGPGNRTIESFVHRGGAYLGFCAGGYYGSARCEFEVGHAKTGMEVIGNRELAFFPGTCRGGALNGFRYASESGARAAKLAVCKDSLEGLDELPHNFRCYYNGGGVFVDAAKMKDKGVEILAAFEDELDVDPGEGKAALVYCKVGSGGAILTGPHPEFSAVNLKPHPEIEGYDKLIDALAEDEVHRTTFLKACLSKLGLKVNCENVIIPSISKMHLSAIDPPEVGGLLAAMSSVIQRCDTEQKLICGENDTFYIEYQDSPWDVKDLHSALEKSAHDSRDDTRKTNKYDPAKAAAIDGILDNNKLLKTIVPHDFAWPDSKETPFFNHHDFYASLHEFRRREMHASSWGDILLYGEVVTSTNSILEKNPSFLAKLPTGFTMTATTQIAGRGRGSNVWLAPPGCTIFSTVINQPSHQGASWPVVFVQYLAAIAIIEAVTSYDGRVGGAYEALPVKLKWPNDVYAQDPTNPWKDPVHKEGPNYVKIGGVLTNCVYSNDQYQIVVGIGLNTTNEKPTTSLDALLPFLAKTSPPLSFRSERLLARLLTRLEALYAEFLIKGFTENLEKRYYAAWLHSDQEVRLDGEGGVRARIVGITRDWGLLRARELDHVGRETGREWALQSDENSFDFWAGLVKRKM